MRRVWNLVLAFLLLPIPFCLAEPSTQTTKKYDVVIYGATSSGVMMAITAGREHLRVALVEPSNHVGGILTGGLSASDIANPDVIGGIAREFFDRMGTYYETAQYGHSTSWNFEPHVAEQILQEMLKAAGVTVVTDEPLLEKQKLIRKGTHLVSFQTLHYEWSGSIFADCSYEGDLLASAGISYATGREGVKQYNEKVAGVQAHSPLNQLPDGIRGYDSTGKLLPQIHRGAIGEPGSGDDKVQSFNFRLILSRDPQNSLSFVRPDGYDPKAYALFAQLWPALKREEGRAVRLGDVLRIVPIPHHKADFNNNGGFSTDFLNQSWEYLKLNREGRSRVFEEHKAYTQGMLYFLANDPSVPINVRQEMKSWGLAKDEFIANGHWPPQLYIREGRRMVGDFVLTEKDLIEDRTKSDSIGMGSHNIDSHNVQRVVTSSGFAINEGDVEEHVQPYALPYRILLPKANEADNLLVPTCVSASHVAFSSLRMEPQYMILGQAAGEAAALAVRDKTSVQKIDVAQLQKKLLDAGAILSYPIKTNYVVQ